jgi:hypothetical protein
MNDNERLQPPPEGDVRARHGYRNEVSWEGGRGRQPYANQGDEELGADAAPEVEAGNAGDISGNNVEELRAVKQKPDRTESEVPRSTEEDPEGGKRAQ